MKFKSVFIFVFFALLISSSVCLADEIFKISGVNEEIETNIQSYLSTSNINCETPEKQLTQFIESLPKKIQTATQPFGFYEPKTQTEKLPKSKNCIKLLLEIDLGKPILVNKIDIKLTDEYQINQDSKLYNQLFPLRKGDILVHHEYENFKSSLFEQASELGYLDAKFTENTIDVFLDKCQANISLHFDTGVRYKVEKIDIIQTPGFLRDDFIMKFVTIKQGKYFTNSEIFELRKKLASTGYFEQISIEIDFDNRKNGLVPLKISVTPGDRIKYSAGVGLSTDTGPRMTFDYNQNRVTDFGYQLNSKLSLSNVISEFSVGLKMPSKSNPVNKWYNIEAGYRRERTNTASSDTSKLGFSQTRIQENKWQNINYMDLVNEKFDNEDTQKSSSLVVPGTSWSYLQTDNKKIPLRGFKIQSELRGSSDALLSDVTFAQLNISYKTIFPIKEKNRLIYRAEIGTTFIDDLSLLPSSYRYYTGGDSSVRGFNYNTLSPTNDEGKAIGGKHLFINSLEYEHRIKDQWAIAVFADTGNAFSNKFKLEKSIGAGARWFSPIGPVRLDIGIPINDDENDFQIHITVGPDF